MARKSQFFLNDFGSAGVYPSEVVMHAAAGEIVLEISEPLEKGPTFDQLMAAHRQMVVRTAYRLMGRMEDAQDVAQEVFLRLLRNFAKIDGDPKAWLYRVTVNVCNDQHRRRSVAGPTEMELVDAAPSPERVLELDERKRLLMAGMDTLAARERAAIVLRDIEGLSTREVAGILGIEEATVRSQISVARVKLAKYVRGRR